MPLAGSTKDQPANVSGAPRSAVRPLRSDAARNRRALVAAAREVFERDGFVRARIADIAAAAGVAHGSFYSHFDNKEQALAAVLDEVEEEMLHPGPGAIAAHDDPIAVIESANRAYLEAYRRNAKLMALLEQVATVDPQFLRLRLKRTDAFVARNARAIRRLQRHGLADSELDPDLTAVALSAMVSRTAYVEIAIRRKTVDLDRLTATLTRLWANALTIPRDRSD
jgi:AcrR family transcriptional regulator